jgi:fluoride exporter
MTALLVVLGAAVGAPLRYAVDRLVQARHRSGFPWGTFAVNAAASLVLGLTLGAAAPPEVGALVGIGFCGALSTYSTFGLETVLLAEDRKPLLAVANVTASVLACLGAAALGFALGSAS